MNITIKPHAEKKDIFTVFIDEEPWRNIHSAVFGRYPKPFKPQASREEWNVTFQALEYRKTKEYVLRRLSAKSYHSSQLKKLLKERLVDPKIVDRLIQECTDWGFLNDKAWLDSFMRVHRKKYSKRAIEAKLRVKGIPVEVLKDLLDEWNDPEEEIKIIQTLIKTKYRSKNLGDFKDKQKVIASLMRKGFGFTQINSVFNMSE